MVRRALTALSVGLALAACGESRLDAGDSGSYGGYMDDDIPAGEQCTTTGTVFETETESCEGGAGDTASDEDQCQSSSECAEGQACAALFDGDRRPYGCLPACLEAMDDDFWCADAGACCNAYAECTPRGYCVVPEAGTTGTTSGGTTDGTG